MSCSPLDPCLQSLAESSGKACHYRSGSTCSFPEILRDNSVSDLPDPHLSQRHRLNETHAEKVKVLHSQRGLPHGHFNCADISTVQRTSQSHPAFSTRCSVLCEKRAGRIRSAQEAALSLWGREQGRSLQRGAVEQECSYHFRPRCPWGVSWCP